MSLSQQHLEEYFTFLRFQSVSTDPAYKAEVLNCANWLKEKLLRIGLEASTYETKGNPIIVAKNGHQPQLPTVLIYGHYDVQPVDPIELWEHPPFEPHLENSLVFARGAADNKGQIFAHILGVEETLREKGSLPINLIFLIEGEEEVGSINLVTFLEEHKEMLKCDVVAISDTDMVAPGQPTLTCGLRGITALEVTLTGPKIDLHSGLFGGAVANPVTELARLIATLHDKNGKVAVKGFYDDVETLEKWERKAWKKLSNDEKLLSVTGSPTTYGEKGYSSVERTCGRPTLELNGMGGGYQGAGTKTVIASKAEAKITCRLVPNQDPKDIEEKVRKHLLKYCPKSVRIEIKGGHHGPAYKLNPHSRIVDAAKTALRKSFPGKEPALIRDGGSIPIVANFKTTLGVDSLLVGLSLATCKIHSPNENFPLENLEAGMRMNRVLLEELKNTDHK